MIHFRWRRPSRVVAYVDWGISTISLFITVVLCIIFAKPESDKFIKGFVEKIDPILGGKIKLNPIQDPTDHEDFATIVMIMWIFFAILGVTSCIYLWTASMLLKATREGAKQRKAVRRARIWRLVTTFLFLLVAVCWFMTGLYFWLVVYIVLFRGILLFIAWNYIRELDQSITSGFTEIAPDNNVVVIKT